MRNLNKVLPAIYLTRINIERLNRQQLPVGEQAQVIVHITRECLILNQIHPGNIVEIQEVPGYRLTLGNVLQGMVCNKTSIRCCPWCQTKFGVREIE